MKVVKKAMVLKWFQRQCAAVMVMKIQDPRCAPEGFSVQSTSLSVHCKK